MSEALPRQVDLAVIGAGSAGAAAAAHAAKAGMRVLCLDRLPASDAGARWVNGVPRSAFANAGFSAPRGDELLGDNHPFVIVAGWSGARTTIIDHHLLDVDMRRLVARLQRLALDRGATIRSSIAVLGLEGDELHTEQGSVRARYIVDASGLAGVNLLNSEKVPIIDLCAAAQGVYKVNDDLAAESFFARHEVPFGALLCFTGVEGGYSIVNLRCHGDEVSILTGSIPALGFPSGKAMLERFVASHSWIGRRVFGGSRAVPLRRPYDRLANGRVAAIGDAACQVFSAHGSGVGAGMIAARTLVDALVAGEGLTGYAWRWQRSNGGDLAAYDVFRRFSQGLDQQTVGRMIEAGLLDEALSRMALQQRFPFLPPAAALQKTINALAAGRLGGRLIGVVAKMAAARALYGRYPKRAAGLRRWSRLAARLLGDSR